MKNLNIILTIFFMVLGCENEEQTPENSSPPSSITLSLSNNVLTWTMNNDDDFSKYSLIGSIKTESPQSGAPKIWDTLLYETQTRLDTSYALDSSEFYSTYQVNVTNNSELTSFSNFISGWVSLWGEYYFIDETDSLMLNGAGLTGEIPLEIGNLTNLTILSLVDNPSLTGPIPMEIGNLVNLTHLTLSNNSLAGQIPFTLGFLANVELQTGMYKLSYLDLSHNQLTEEIEYQLMELGGSLTHLDLSNNQLTGEIPTTGFLGNEPGIGDLKYLTTLYLNHNQFTGDIPPRIGNLNYLTKLHLNDNQFTGVPEGFNEVTGEVESALCNLNFVWGDSSIFNLSNNKLCSPYPPCIEEYLGVQDTTNCE